MDTLARLLWDARQFGFTVPREELAEITDLKAAYGIQARQVQYSGKQVGGWKLGATAPEIMALIGLPEPCTGPVFADQIVPGGGYFAVFPEHNTVIETEVALRLADRLPPRPEPWTREEVAERVASAHAAFEVVGFRFEGGPKGAGPLLVADGAVNAGAVIGDEIPLDALAEGLAVTVMKNGEVAAESATTALMWEDHLDALIWLAARQDQLARRLQPGDLVLTGTVAGLIPAAPDDRLQADFGGLARVSLTLSEA